MQNIEGMCSLHVDNRTSLGRKRVFLTQKPFQYRIFGRLSKNVDSGFDKKRPLNSGTTNESLVSQVMINYCHKLWQLILFFDLYND